MDGSVAIRRPDSGRRGFLALLRTAVPCLLAGLATACASTVSVQGAREQAPLVARQEARIGVLYTAPVRTAEYSDPLVRVPIGSATVSRLDQAFESLFGDIVRLPDWPPWRSGTPDVDAVIEVDTARIDITPGTDYRRPRHVGVLLDPSVSRPDELSIYYRACLYQPTGTLITCWEANASATHQRQTFESYVKSTAALADSTMSDAIAKLMLTIQDDPDAKAWLVAARRGQQ